MEKDTRTIKEIYDGCTSPIRSNLVRSIAWNAQVTESSARNWIAGRRLPAPLYRQVVADTICSICGIVTTPDTLFAIR